MCAVDLHTHSNKSDGSLSPTELVYYAIEKGLSAIALTDHDTADGLDEAMKASIDKPIEVIPGIEFSTEYMGRDIHIVGLYIDYRGSVFTKSISDFQASRELRNEKMCKKLRDEAGIDITYEALKASDPGAVITRAHYGKYLVNHGYVKTVKDGFDKYLGDHTKYFVPREKITPSQAVRLILDCGGLPVLAHPILYHMTKSQLRELVSTLKNDGLVGIEAIYSTYAPSEERLIKTIASEYQLAISGGSDFHGAVKPGLDLGSGYGKLYIHDDVLKNLKALL